MRNRNKGFTLVEIIISITIGSVVLALMGTMILTSSNFMSNTTNSDMDKRCVDSCMEFIRDQIEYSTDVRIIENKGLDNYPVEGEDNWHCFYIKNHILYRDDSPVFDDSFYNHKQLEILVKDDYKNNMRVDFTYHLNDSDGEKAYGNRDTVVFLNISEKNKPDGGLYVSSDVSLDSSKDNYAVYYKKSLKTNNSSNTPSGDNDNVRTGTVTDRLNMINLGNRRGNFDYDKQYNNGDYVYYEGYWWYCRGSNIKNVLPDQYNNTVWTKLDKNYQLDDYCCYYKNDIVIYEGKYIVCNVNYVVGSKKIPDIGENNYNQWRIISKEEALEISGSLTNAYSFDIKCVNSKLPSNIDMTDTKRESIPLYDETKLESYQVGDYVRIKDKNNDYYYVYLKVLEGNNKEPGSSMSSGWQLLEPDFDPKSSYVVGDYTIGSTGGGGNNNSFTRKYLKCKRDVLTTKSYEEYKQLSSSNENYSQLELRLYNAMKGYSQISDIGGYFYEEFVVEG